MPIPERFKDREHAAELLARRLAAYAGRADVTVIGLPRGGVPVAAVIAARLQVALDILLVRKLGVPGQPELAFGAVASGGLCVLQPDTVAALHISRRTIGAVARREMAEIERREALYGVVNTQLARPSLHGRVLIIVDDGIATGATMRAAIEALRQTRPARVMVAVPVGPHDTCAALRAEVDELVCLNTPPRFFAVGQWYRHFDQVGDDQVRALLEAARRRQAMPADAPRQQA